MEGLISAVIGAAVVVIMSILAVFVFWRLEPVLALEVEPRWADGKKELLILKLQIKNASGRHISNPNIRLQVLEHRIPDIVPCNSPSAILSEWVPFERQEIRANETPLDWHNPEKIFVTTRGIAPGEIISVEWCYSITHDAMLHIGLQVQANLGFLTGLARLSFRPKNSWTTTCIVARRV